MPSSALKKQRQLRLGLGRHRLDAGWLAGLPRHDHDHVDHHGLFFFNDTATPDIYTLSLHDALPICAWRIPSRRPARWPASPKTARDSCWTNSRSEEHTSELQSHHDLVCRLLLE